jgi:extracellular elastinolytic metalloproteinase
LRRLSVLPRRARAALLPLAGLSVVALTLASSGLAVVHLGGQSTGLRDFDARARVAPTKAQLQAARSIHGRVTWSTLGAPASVIRYGGYLATGIKAPSAAAAARSWLAAHKQLFQLRTVRHLRVATAAPLRGSRVHAVVFRQTFGGVLSADGVATVTVVRAKHAWKVVYASSNLTPDTIVTGKRLLRPVVAWRKAARAAGARAAQVAPLGTSANGALGLAAAGFSGVQTVRPTVFGTPRKGAIRAYDATVTKSTVGEQSSYRVIVDAATGKLLYRQNLVDNLTNNPTWLAFAAAPAFNPMNAYPWNYPSTDIRQLYCWTTTAGCANVVSDDPATTTRRCSVPPHPRLPAVVHERVVHVGLRPVPRHRPHDEPDRERHRGGRGEPVRRAQHDARLLVLPRVRRGALERPAVQQRAWTATTTSASSATSSAT